VTRGTRDSLGAQPFFVMPKHGEVSCGRFACEDNGGAAPASAARLHSTTATPRGQGSGESSSVPLAGWGRIAACHWCPCATDAGGVGHVRSRSAGGTSEWNGMEAAAYRRPAGSREPAMLPDQVLAVPAVPVPEVSSKRSTPSTAPLKKAVLPLIVLSDEFCVTPMPFSKL
jgi:hypothetical protein